MSRGTGGRSGSGRGMRKMRDMGNGWDDQGGYMNAKIRKLERQFTTDRPLEIQDDNASSSLFTGVAIFVNGYTIPSSDELKKLMLQHGGMYHHYYARSKVTHIIASNLPNSKIDKIHDKKIVKPEWITDSVKAQKCLPYENYLLYTARSTIQPGLQRYASTPAVSVSFINASTSSLPTETFAPTDLSTKGHEGPDNDSVPNDDEIPPAQPRDPQLQSSNPKCQDSSANSHQTHKSPPNASSVERAQAKAGDPGFVSEFYNHSRLHYLSTWGAEFRVYVNELQVKGGSSFPGRDKLKRLVERNSSDRTSKSSSQEGEFRTNLTKTVMHIDMDCFFVSVGLRSRPDLVGKPVVVTHSRGKGAKERPGADPEYERQHYRKWVIERSARKAGVDLDQSPDMSRVLVGELSTDEQIKETEENDAHRDTVKANYKSKELFLSMAEIASASYEARKAGVKNGMFMGPAKQLCPDLVPIPYDFEGYREVSQKLYDTVASYTHDIEAVSCDEMLVDLTDVLNETNASAEQLASVLRQEIYEKTQCRASVGMGPNILTAKLATKKAKPNGQFYVYPAEINSFILDKAVKDLPGVGWSTSHKLQNMNVTTCQDLQRVPLSTLQREFGPKTGQSLYRSCRGQDDRAIKMEKERKSVSAEINYGIRFSEESELENFIAEVAQEVHNRMERIKVKGRTVTLKLKIRAKNAPVETAKYLGHGICDKITKSATLPMATDSSSMIHKECMGIIKSLHIAPSEYRGVGIQLSKLESSEEEVALTSKGLQSILNFASKIEPRTTPSAFNTVCKELKDNQKEEPVANTERRRHPSLPPLPALPDLNGSGSSQDTPKTPETTVREVPGSRPKEELYLPSPSQVDLNVLKELPSDIRQQLEQDLRYRSNKYKYSNKENCTSSRQLDNYDDHADSDGVQPGCSNWEPPVARSGLESKGTGIDTDRSQSLHFETKVSVDMTSSIDPSYSQIDPSVLAALPAEIQKELEVQLKHELVPNGHEKVMQAQLNSKSQSKSPKKSPNRTASRPGSPRFKVPRGRPPGKKNKPPSLKKLDFGKQHGDDSRLQQEQEIFSTGSTEPETQLEWVTESTESAQKTSKLNQEATNVFVPEPINLCGAVTLSEIKNLLQEWISSTKEPENDDVARFVQYLFDLVDNKDLEKVYLILKALKRKVNRSLPAHTAEWIKTYDLVVFRTQSIVQSQYEATLKL